MTSSPHPPPSLSLLSFLRGPLTKIVEGKLFFSRLRPPFVDPRQVDASPGAGGEGPPPPVLGRSAALRTVAIFAFIVILKFHKVYKCQFV